MVFAPQGKPPELPARLRLPSGALGGFKGEFRELRLFGGGGGLPRTLVIGQGKRGDLDLERVRRLGALAARRAEAEGAARAAVWTGPDLVRAAGGARPVGQALSEGALMGPYRFERFRSKAKPERLRQLELHGEGSEFRAGAERGQVLAEANALARDLQNTPANRMRPRDLAAAARKIAAGSARIRCRVLERAALRRLGMGALLGVSEGSEEPPCLIHLVHRPRVRSKARIALVGKGLTFDAGGISIKPAAKMWEMKFDMSGGAAVLGTFQALRRLSLPLEVHGVVPASENLPDGRAVKPGDLLTAMDGRTIEVLNTDAEGRLILADALAYCVAKIEPDTIIDLATLTGAVVVALGHEFSGLFASSERLREDLCRAGDAVGERLWPLPLSDFHKDWMKGDVADLKNISTGDQGAGSSAGAAFLSGFAGGLEWAHLDIAGTAWGGMNRDWVGGNLGSGVGVRLLGQYLLGRA